MITPVVRLKGRGWVGLIVMLGVVGGGLWHPATAQDESVRETLKADFPMVSAPNDVTPVINQVFCSLYGFQCLWVPQSHGFNQLRVGLNLAEFSDEQRRAELFSVLSHWQPSGGGVQAYGTLLYGYWDLIIVTSPPAQRILDKAARQGVAFDMQPVALDALVMAVHDANPIAMLTLDQVRSLYAHQITTWTELGVIAPLATDPANTIRFPMLSGDGYYPLPMDRLVLPAAQYTPNSYPMTNSELGPVSSLRQINIDPQGIGHVSFYTATHMEPRAHIKLLGIDGIFPTRDTIADRSYPLTYEVYVVIRAGMPPDSPAVLLRDWLLTPDGQAVVAASGYVPLGSQNE